MLNTRVSYIHTKKNKSILYTFQKNPEIVIKFSQCGQIKPRLDELIKICDVDK